MSYKPNWTKLLKGGLLIVGVLLIVDCFAQSPYQLNWKTERNLLLAGGITGGIGLYFNTQTNPLDQETIATLDKRNINGLDRIAVNNYSTDAAGLSDIVWGSSHVLPLLYLSSATTNKEFGKIAALYGEAFLLNISITGLIKYTVRRSRPFVYNPTVELAEKQTKTARSSFLSGHTSVTATNCFFVAKVFSDYFPDSKWKPLVWTGAATIPALAGYLRVKAGKHFPTDTIAGYALGAAAGILVPQLHKQKDGRFHAFAGGQGIILQWQF